MIIVPKYVSRVVFKGGILGGARQFWGNPYLNSTTVLFDIYFVVVATSLHKILLLYVGRNFNMSVQSLCIPHVGSFSALDNLLLIET